MSFRPTHLAVIALVFWLSCDESLPPRQDPSHVFHLKLTPYYEYTQSSNFLQLQISFINSFDETLSGLMALDGTVVIASERNPSIHRTLPIASQNLVRAHYDASSGNLTLDPGDSIVVAVNWDFTDDTGRRLQSILFEYSVDSSCASREISNPEIFDVTATTRLFAPLALTDYHSTFTFRHYLQWVSPHDCVPL
jgi:hypothetical protein